MGVGDNAENASPFKGRVSTEEKKQAESRKMTRELLWSIRHLVPMLALSLTGVAMLVPSKALLVTNYFASQIAGHPIVCQDYTAAEKPTACINASGESAQISAILSAAGAGVAFVASPLMGALSDVYGRRPFLVATSTVSLVPVGLFCAFALQWLSAWPFLIALYLQTSLSSVTVALAYVADVVSPHNRAAGFGLVLASITVAMILGSALGGLLPFHVVLIVACALSLAATLYTIFILPESLPLDCRKGFTYNAVNPIKAMSILGSTPLFRKLTLCVLAQAMCSDGLQDVFIYYLQELFNFGRSDTTLALILLGVTGTLTQAFAIKPLTRLAGHRGLLILGLVSTLINNIGFIFLRSKTLAFVNIALPMAAGLLTFPAVSAIKSINVSEAQQGQVQGALYGIRQFAAGVGPITFSTVYNEFNHRTGSLPFFPQSPFVLGAVLMVVAIVFAVWMPNPVPDLAKRQTRFIARTRAHSIPAYMPSTPHTPRSQRRTLSFGDALTDGSPLLGDFYNTEAEDERMEAGKAGGGVSGPPNMQRLTTLP